MLIRNVFRPSRIWPYVRLELLIVTGLAVALVILQRMGFDLAIPFLPLGVLGTAVAITMGFRNNTAYARWWEARTIWGTIVNVSRQYARLVVTFTRSHAHQPTYDASRADGFIDVMVRRQIAWVNILRHQLRREPLAETTLAHLQPDQRHAVASSVNPATTALVQAGTDIYQAMAVGTLQGFDSFQLEGCLAQLQAAQGSCERIKNTPLPKQYAFFTTVFMWTFILMTPFGLLSLFSASAVWAVIPVTAVLTFAFTIVDKIGRVTEDPFEGRPQDVPLTAICRTIERELLELLGTTPLPPAAEPVDGYLL